MPTVTIKKDVKENYVVDAMDTKYVLDKGVEIHGTTRGIEEGAGFNGNSYVLNGKVSASADNGTAIVSHGEGAEFRIGLAGRVASDYGVYTDGAGAVVTNNGRIEAGKIAVEMEGEGATLINHGTITSDDGYSFFGIAATGFTLQNDGLMSSKLGLRFDGDDLTLRFGEDSVVRARNDVIALQGDMDDTSLIVNRGLIEATNTKTFMQAILGDEANDTVRNYGTIKGDVRLGGGNDEFVDRGGKVLRGNIFGDDGSDDYVLGSDVARAFERSGEGYDTMTIKFSHVMESGNEMEEVHLAGKGDFRIVANDLGVALIGNAGDNRLVGGTGGDTFYGGAGKDILTGGEGADVFIFRPGYGRDIVMDFEDGVDHIVLQGDEIDSIAELLANHVKDVEGGMLIYGDGTRMFLKGMDVAHFSADDFTG